MKFIPEASFEELLNDGSLTGIIDFFEKLLKAKGHDFEQLWNDGETRKIEKLLPPGQWKKFEQARTELINQVRENSSKPISNRDIQNWLEEIKSLRGNLAILQAAEALRKGRSGKNYVRPFNSKWLSSDQLILLREAQAALEPTRKKTSDTNRRNRLGKRGSAVTKKHLEEFRDEFAKNNNGKTYGWKRAACDKLLLDYGTLRKIMEETE
jgi:hypothetical protein